MLNAVSPCILSTIIISFLNTAVVGTLIFDLKPFNLCRCGYGGQFQESVCDRSVFPKDEANEEEEYEKDTNIICDFFCNGKEYSEIVKELGWR